ncbi:hypothetical protein [Croceicoccus gelatinilyticus]|uniref:hypothetical protein n=1 Tax=Croceicoccus gelatinilyticus TaxID=2835536 RepID=UPI001BCCA41E|nr:hypothetical protein [Croceicoccus gelatinilyticus]MBS7671677.1 hypothetical protein [Croceicoccus gelatinilyticus]
MTSDIQRPLPAPDQRPWWQEPLQDLTDEIRAKEPDWGWTHGGCWAFAAALAKAYGGERRVVLVWDKRADDWWGHHAVVEMDDGRTYDYEGVFEMPAGGGFDGHAIAKLVPPDGEDGYHWLDDEIWLSDDQLSRLDAIFK